MLSKKQFEIAVIGKTYLSLLFAHSLVTKKKDVIFLMDPRFSLGNNYISLFSFIEKEFLKTWGLNEQIETLINIDDYIKPVSLMFHLGQGQKILLGSSSPYKNLRELSRKFSFLFNEAEIVSFNSQIKSNEEEFNKMFFSFLLRMAKNSYNYHGRHNFSLDVIKNLCPQKILKIFEEFSQKIFDQDGLEKFEDIQEFITGARFFLQKKFDLGSSNIDFFHLFISFLSPSYRINHSKLFDDLFIEFKKKGGKAKDAHVKNWQFQGKLPWCLELDSYEGVLRVKKIFLFGGEDTSKIPFKISWKGENLLRCLKINYHLVSEKFDGDLFCFENETQHIFSSKNKFRSQNPFWFIEKIDDSTISLYFYYHFFNGENTIQLEKKAKKIFQDEFEKISGRSDFSDIFLVQDVFWEGDVIPSHYFPKINELRSDSTPTPPPSVSFLEAPGVFKELRDVYYMGPLREQNFGPWGQLMEMKDWEAP